MTNEMLGKYPQLTGLAKFTLFTNAKAKLIAQHYNTLKSGLSGQFPTKPNPKFKNLANFRARDKVFQEFYSRNAENYFSEVDA